MGRKRLGCIADLHCGHIVGLTPPAYQLRASGKDVPKQAKWARIERDCWAAYIEGVRRMGRLDCLVVNGDCIDGTGGRSGGTELITPDREIQTDMAIAAIKCIKAKHVVITYGCLTAGHRILTADLRYVPVETLVVGDRLLAFDANATDGRKRRWVEAAVTANGPITKDVYDIELSDGTHIVATPEHPFLVRTQPYKWRTVEQLYRALHYHDSRSTHKREHREGMRKGLRGLRFGRSLPVWDSSKSYEGGYLAGFFDGEGSCSQRIKGDRSGWVERTLSISAAQKDNAAPNHARHCLAQLGFRWSGAPPKGRDVWHIKLLGGAAECLRFLGTVRPRRLLDVFDVSRLGTVRNLYKDGLWIVDIRPAGAQTVYALGTSTGTYVSEGFLSHNTPYHSGDQEDWENIIAKDIGAKIGSHEWVEVNGVTFDFKHFIGGSSIPHGAFTAPARDWLWNVLWAAHDEQPQAQIVVRSHIHRASRCGVLGEWDAYTTPALQAMGSKYGARRCSARVHFGLLWWEVDEHGNVTSGHFIPPIRVQRATAIHI